MSTAGGLPSPMCSPAMRTPRTAGQDQRSAACVSRSMQPPQQVLLLTAVEHGRLILLSLADDHHAVHGDVVQHLAHHVHSSLVGARQAAMRHERCACMRARQGAERRVCANEKAAASAHLVGRVLVALAQPVGRAGQAADGVVRRELMHQQGRTHKPPAQKGLTSAPTRARPPLSRAPAPAPGCATARCSPARRARTAPAAAAAAPRVLQLRRQAAEQPGEAGAAGAAAGCEMTRCIGRVQPISAVLAHVSRVGSWTARPAPHAIEIKTEQEKHLTTTASAARPALQPHLSHRHHWASPAPLPRPDAAWAME